MPTTLGSILSPQLQDCQLICTPKVLPSSPDPAGNPGGAPWEGHSWHLGGRVCTVLSTLWDRWPAHLKPPTPSRGTTSDRWESILGPWEDPAKPQARASSMAPLGDCICHPRSWPCPPPRCPWDPGGHHPAGSAAGDSGSSRSFSHAIPGQPPDQAKMAPQVELLGGRPS